MRAMHALIGAMIGSVAAAGLIGTAHASDATGVANDGRFQVAQLRLEFGTSDQRVRRALRQDGYTEIEITERGLTKAIALACKDGVRYRLVLRPSGRIRNRNRVADCRPKIDIQQAEALLQREGYRRINVQEQGGVPYVAIACRNGRRYRINVNIHGDINEDRNLGPCREALQPDDIAAQLRRNGYDRIRFTDRRLPRYEAEACRDNTRVQLVIGRRGRIRDERRIGRCDPPINPNQIEATLIDRGFDRIEVFDRTPPRFEAEVCRGTDRIDLILGVYGDVIRQVRVGSCPPPVSEAELARNLARGGFTKVAVSTIDDDDKPYSVTACQNDERFSLAFSKYGEVVDEKRLGICTSPRVEEVFDRYEERGFEGMTLTMEGCRRNRRVEIKLNEYGEVIERNWLGRCN